MRTKRFRRICLAILVLLGMTIMGCATQPAPDSFGSDLPGFWWGLLHGFLMPFTFVGSLFSHVRIYNFPNSGRWYDFGYLIGAATILGGSGSAA